VCIAAISLIFTKSLSNILAVCEEYSTVVIVTVIVSFRKQPMFLNDATSWYADTDKI